MPMARVVCGFLQKKCVKGLRLGQVKHAGSRLVAMFCS